MTEDQIYSLCEAVADIAYLAGTEKYYSGNSRADNAQLIEWAKEFEKKWEGHKWGIDDGPDYIEAIEDYVEEKLK